LKIDIRAILKGLGYNIPDASVYKHIVLWREWYQGHHAKFHDYQQFNGKSKVKRRRKSLKMAKKVCEDHANLLLNEKVQLTVTPDTAQKKVDAALKENKFRIQSNKLVEVAFALGTGAFVEHSDSSNESGVLIDYVRADMIFPISWESEDITECAFASLRNNEGKDYIYLNIHKLENAEYVIYNKMIPIDASSGSPMFSGAGSPEEITPNEADNLLPGGIEPEVHTGSLTPRFQIIGPNAVNNIDTGSPMGVSIFANSIDLLEGIDLIYDSYCSEFQLGKKRIIVPASMLQMVQDSSGLVFPLFDDNDTEFYAMKDDNQAELKEINMTLRIDEHDKGLQRLLNLLSDKCGLGNDRYNFESGQAKTATEVISEKSDLFQNLKKNELVLETALQNMCQAIAEIAGVKGSIETTVNFDDSIIEDTEAKRTRMQLLVSQGMFPKARYLQEYEGYSEKEVKEIMAELEGESAGSEIDYEDVV